MDLNFVFTAVVALDFVVRFEVTVNNTQDYFLFSGVDSTAHLYRENDTIRLFLRYKSNQQLFTLDEVFDGDTLTFDWDQKTVNSVPMNTQDHQSDMDRLEFDAYTFLSPIVEVQQLKCPIMETVYQCNGTNYRLIALIIFAIGLGLKFDIAVPAILNILQNLQRVEEAEYIEMGMV